MCKSTNKDEKDLKKKLEFLINNESLVKKIGEESKTYVKDNFNWDNITKATLDVYKDLVK